ncbi:hypothetical protein [Streptomyces sp. NBC_01615]|uniref:hypothetical protein n=1 Tax=Streptomyces sp. NBC_01615 TaxID=2975898 RepID=UPI003866C91A
MLSLQKRLAGTSTSVCPATVVAAEASVEALAEAEADGLAVVEEEAEGEAAGRGRRPWAGFAVAWRAKAVPSSPAAPAPPSANNLRLLSRGWRVCVPVMA